MTQEESQPKPADDSLFVDASTAQDNTVSQTQTVKKDYKINHLSYDGRTGIVFKIWLVNIFLNILTLGIYSFWGKTKMRRYVAGSYLLDGDRFEYTGSGKELFLGFVRAIPLFVIAFGPLIAADILYPEELPVWFLLTFLPMFYFFGIAKFSATRYRLNRTTWRGIRGHVTGSAFSYANLAMWCTFLNIISFGILIPYSDIAKHKKIIDQTFFGNIHAEYVATAKPLMGVHIITIFLAIPTLGMSRIWYHAALMRQKMIGIYAGDYRFKSDVSGFDILKLMSGNTLIWILTLGIGHPIVIQRKLKFFAHHTFVGGNLKTGNIKQAAENQPGMGEGLDDIMGIDSGIMG